MRRCGTEKNQGLPHYRPGVSDDVGQGTSLQELHDNPELISHQVAVVHLDHILVLIVPHDHHLEEQTQIVLVRPKWEGMATKAHLSTQGSRAGQWS